MRTLLHIISFEWKKLWRSKSLAVLMVVVFGSGIYGIFFGKFEIDKQEMRMAYVQDHERKEFDSLVVWARLDTTIVGNKEKYQRALSPTGVGWNKHFTYYMTHETPAGAGLCLGQRDLFPVYYGFNVSDLARQVNTGEVANPMKLLTGNFDLAYVFVFLFPLLVVALFYDLFASEREGGTLLLLQSQSTALNKILLSKGVFRLLIVWGMAIVLIILGFLFQGIPIGSNSSLMFQWTVLVFGYCLFWVLIMGMVVRLRRSSSVSAIIGLGIWLIFTLITPALLNLFVLAKEPLPNRAEMIDAVRNLNDQVWEKPKSFVWESFYEDYPHFKDGDTTNFNKWYYASFVLIDKEADEMKSQFEEQVRKRNELLERWSWIAPAASMHERLSKISGTDRNSHLNFITEINEYHQELKNLYYKRIFSGEQFTIEDLKSLGDKL